MVIRFYPHTLTYQPAGESVQDENGNWTTEGSDEVMIKCRFETNAKSSLIKTSDGNDFLYSGVAWLKGFNIIPVGSFVTIVGDKDLVAKGKVVKNDNAAQTTNRIWI